MRIQVEGIVLRPSGHGWVVGRAKPRVIKGADTEEVISPNYFARAAWALAYFIRRVYDECGGEPQGQTRQILEALSLARMGQLPVSLRHPPSLVRRARGNESQREFAGRAGISRSTLQDIEAGRTRDPHLSTITAILEASDDGS